MWDVVCVIHTHNSKEAKDKAVIAEGALLHVLRLISRMRRCRVQNNLAVLWQSEMQTIHETYRSTGYLRERQ